MQSVNLSSVSALILGKVTARKWHWNETKLYQVNVSSLIWVTCSENCSLYFSMRTKISAEMFIHKLKTSQVTTTQQWKCVIWSYISAKYTIINKMLFFILSLINFCKEEVSEACVISCFPPVIKCSSKDFFPCTSALHLLHLPCPVPQVFSSLSAPIFESMHFKASAVMLWNAYLLSHGKLILRLLKL